MKLEKRLTRIRQLAWACVLTIMALTLYAFLLYFTIAKVIVPLLRPLFIWG